MVDQEKLSGAGVGVEGIVARVALCPGEMGWHCIHSFGSQCLHTRPVEAVSYKLLLLRSVLTSVLTLTEAR